MPTKLHQALRDLPISTLLKHRDQYYGRRQLIAVKENTPITRVLDIMHKENILAVALQPSSFLSEVYYDIVSNYDILSIAISQGLFDDMENNLTCEQLSDAMIDLFKSMFS
jgi:hypothetical protein